MSPGPSQLPLGVGLRDDATFANYLPGDNASLVAHLMKQLDESGESFLYLWGSEGVGCSHLLQAACHNADARGKRALYLPLDMLGHFPPDILEEPERLDLLAIDDLQLVVGRKRWEEALFHGFNRLRDAGKRLVIAADRSPRQLARRANPSSSPIPPAHQSTNSPKCKELSPGYLRCFAAHAGRSICPCSRVKGTP